MMEAKPEITLKAIQEQLAAHVELAELLAGTWLSQTGHLCAVVAIGE